MSEAAARRPHPAGGGLTQAGLAGWFESRADLRAGWAIAFAAGALATLALPPFYLVPVLAVAIPILLWLLAGSASAGRAGLIGFAFGLGHHVAGLYWISESLLIDPWRHGWLIPLFVGGLAAILAIFVAMAAAAARWLAGRNLVALLFALTAFWVVGDWLRSWVFSGFPWNMLGSALLVWEPLAQLAAATGAWGMTMLTLLTAGSLGLALSRRSGWQARIAAVPLAAALLAVCWLGGAQRLAGAHSTGYVEGVALRLVQPNIAQTLKWEPGLAEQHLVKQMQMSLPGDGPHRPTHVIWPETAVPFTLERNPGLARMLARAVPPGGLLITGAPRVSRDAEGVERWHNSLIAIDGEGAVRGSFDKFHLVPFGEYVPIRWIPGVSRIAPGAADFEPGPGPRTLELPGLPPVSPLICYEVIFPGAVTQPGRRPQWLLNITNDAWFGLSTGPHQHFAAARLRAIEEGLPLVRVANTGISGVIDAHGRVLEWLPLGEEGVLDVSLPAALPETIYARLGDAIAGALALSLVALALLSRRR